MLFGHNTNVTVGRDTVHVQTEDRGANHTLIDTTVHWKGRVLHRRTTDYKDLLPLNNERESVLKSRVDEQHRAVIEEIRSGALQLTMPAAAPASPVAVTKSNALRVELINAKTWLAGKTATLQLVVRDSSATAVAGAVTKARVEGSENPLDHRATTTVDGRATLVFEMPRLNAAEAALVIEAERNGAKGQLRFQLRVKPKT